MPLGSQDRLYRYRVPLTVPLRWGASWHTHREGLLVRSSMAGICSGWGEIAPLPGFSTETLSSVEADLRGGCADLDRTVPPSLMCGMETARLHWNLRNAPEAALRRTVLRVCALLAGSAQEVMARAEAARMAGYEAVKLKVGRRKLKADIGMVRKVRRIIGPDVELRLDANRAWSFPDARTFAQGIGGLGVAFVEEPLSDPAKLADIARFMPIALDETLAGKTIGDLPRLRFARAVVIKPMLLGGPGISLAWAEYAAHWGMTPVISAAFETGVGLLGLMHVAGRTTAETPAGLDTYRFIRHDLLVPRLNLSQARVMIPSLESFAVDRNQLERIA